MEKRTLTAAQILKFLIPSLLGAGLFLVPMKIGGKYVLGVSLLCEGVLNLCVALSTVKIIDHQRPDVIETEYTEITEYE